MGFPQRVDAKTDLSVSVVDKVLDEQLVGVDGVNLTANLKDGIPANQLNKILIRFLLSYILRVPNLVVVRVEGRDEPSLVLLCLLLEAELALHQGGALEEDEEEDEEETGLFPPLHLAQQTKNNNTKKILWRL